MPVGSYYQATTQWGYLNIEKWLDYFKQIKGAKKGGSAHCACSHSFSEFQQDPEPRAACVTGM